MPWGDRTGPIGIGPMTGRGAGYCAGFGGPGYTNPAPGFGRGLGRGFGRGRGRGFGRGFCRWGWNASVGYGYPGVPQTQYPAAPYPQISAEQEKQMLQNEAQQLKDALVNLENRIAEIEKQGSQEP